MKGRTRTALSLLLVLFASCGPSQLDPRPPPKPPSSDADKFGSGFVLNDPPKDIKVATDRKNKRVSPKVTKDFKGVPDSNDWWSSLIWQFDDANPYSLNLYAHPLALRATESGLALGYPDEPSIKPREYMHRFDEDLRIGLARQKFPDTRVAGYSDFAVTASWKKKGGSELRTTFGHGLPYVYATKQGNASAVVTIAQGKKAEVVIDEASALFIRVGKHFYGLFGPSNCKWENHDGSFVSDLDGRDYFSVAVLPDGEDTTFALFKAHAHAFVVDTKVSWTYDEASATLETRFDATTEQKEEPKGSSSSPLLALYRHQWKYTKDELLPLSYASPRGAMKLREGADFTTLAKFPGVLPELPNAAKLQRSALEAPIGQVYGADELFGKGYGPGPERDSYWAGKSLARNANVLYIAEQLGHKEAKERLLTGIKNELEDWFDGRAPRYLHYDEKWRSLVALPASYGSSEQLNDHHFHYGYFVGAAAAVARFDPKWAKSWGPMVEVLIRDAANWDRSDTRFPFLRHMDPYAGHSWANGPAQFEEGNNQEASSEDLHFSASVVLWGATTGQKELRDLGIFLYTNQMLAAEQYWFDIDGEVFPESFDHPTVGMVWGAGAKYDTWFDQDPILIHGINFLPFTGSSLYLGRHPEYVQKNFDEVFEKSKGVIYTWRDYMLMYLALSNPKRAAKMLEDDSHFEPEFGNSRAMLEHWVKTLGVLGRVNPRVTANIPTYAVFKSDKGRSYVAFNAGKKKKTVRFSDGTKLSVPPLETAWKRSSD